MKLAAALILVLSTAAASLAQDQNVNSRYIVQKVTVSPERKLSRILREDLHKLVGQNLSQSALDALRDRIRQETGARLVQQRVVRGDKPETVNIVFELRYGQRGIDVKIPKLVYASRLGWNGAADLEAHFAGNTLGFGAVNDGESQVERAAGMRGFYERQELFGRRLGFRFDAEHLRTQWASDNLEPYRMRTNFQPVLTARLWGPLTWSGGVGIQRVETPLSAAKNQGAHAVVQTLRLRQQWSAAGLKQTLEAGYHLRAATHLIASDFVYTRHTWDASYKIQDGAQELVVRAGGGALFGNTPLFERFVAGNTRVLRGYSKFDLTPLGAGRLAAGSVEYHNRGVEAFYDTGSAWNEGGPARVRHSVGCGYRTSKGVMVAVAFPLRGEMISPMILAGINF
jgi:hypothetical protein